jgi:pantoate--beta-alanine ligase
MNDKLPDHWAIVGRGRLGTALAAAMVAAGLEVDGPLSRGATAAGSDAVLLCVPDAEIAAAATAIAAGPLVGHCSGALGLDVLIGHEAFGLHPLMTVTTAGADFAGAGCAVAGSTDRARAAANELARCIGMRPATIADDDRAAYHAAASVASNFLVTLEAASERLAGAAGVDRDLLVPLVRATVENWAAHGPKSALTGPIARGDESTVVRQREAVAERTPDLLVLFDALADATRALVGGAAPGRPLPGSDIDAAGFARGVSPTHPRTTASPDPAPHHTRRGPSPQTVRTVADLRALLEPVRRGGRRIALVPTMGALHDGHLSLIRRARAEADVVVVSVFVNPTQFRPGEDLDAYPRDEARDAALAAIEGSDILFAPPAEEVYPDGFATEVRVAGPLTEALEGAARGPEHFHGVTTVVAKLFDMVGPDAAYFGQKDAQQALVVRRMVHDLDLPVQIVTCPTVREPDGLALSSRNAYLDAADRERAVALRRGLDAAEAAVAAGESDPTVVRAAGRAAMAEFGVEPEYFEIVDTENLSPVAAIDGEALVAVAATVGRARLIDNTIVRTRARVAATPHEPDQREAPCSA